MDTALSLLMLSQGNPGALTFLTEVMNEKDISIGLPILLKLESCVVVGTALYILWNDLGNKDLNKVAEICKKVPNNILIEACKRQDYSGVELIKPYLPGE